MDKKVKPLVLMTDPIHSEVIKNKLKPYARVVIAKNKSDFNRFLKKADALMTLLYDPVTDSTLKSAPKLKVVGNYAVGVENIDLKACKKRKIRVVNTPGVLTRATAELAITLLLAAARRVPEGHQLCSNNRFKGWRPDLLLGKEIKNKKAVILGAGRIGKETGFLLRALGAKVEYITKKDKTTQIQKKLRSAQILSLNVPLRPSTHHWLDTKKLNLLPKDCIVVNTSRGPVIDEKALIRALKSKKIFAAALDVYENEPHIPKGLRELQNVVLLPHVGSSTENTRKKMAEILVDGVLRSLKGLPAKNEVQLK